MVTDSAYRSRFRLTLVLVVLAAPLLIYGAISSLRQMHTEPASWVPHSFLERQEYEWFTQYFERELAVVVSWDGCTVDDPRLLQLENALSDEHTELPVEHRQWFDRVITGYTVVRELESEALKKVAVERRRQHATRRLRGILVGADGKTTCAVVILSEQGASERQRAVDLLRDLVIDTCDVTDDEIHISGPPAQAVAIDRESQSTLIYFTAPCIALALLVCCCCLRSLRYTIVIVATASVGQILVLAALHYVGVRMNAVLAVLPALVFVLTISSGIHLTNYYFDQVRKSRSHDTSVRKAIHIAWLPCMLAVTTTVIGLGSLLLSQIVPIWQFGAIAAGGLVAAVAILFLVVPGALATWPAHALADKCAAEEASGEPTPLDRRHRFWQTLHGLIDRRWLVVATGCLAVMALAGVGLSLVRTTADVRDLMAPESRSMRDLQWMEENVGPLTPAEVILVFDDDCPLSLLDRIELVTLVDEGLQVGRGISGTMTALSFAQKIPTSQRVINRSLTETYLLENNVHERLLETPFLAITDRGEAWRISVRVNVVDNLDYHVYLMELKNSVTAKLNSKWAAEENDALREKWQHGLEKVSQIYTGAMPLSDRAHRALLRDLFVSFLTAFGLVTIVLMIALRSVVAGLLAMLPTVLPTVLVFGTMGWTSTSVDVGSVMTASVALGIAVDDLLHFLTWFRRESREGTSRSEAVRRSLSHCGTAMVQTTMICGLGLIVFALSDFVPAQRFSWMMLILLSGALIADLVLLPALLLSPVGRFFVPRATARLGDSLPK